MTREFMSEHKPLDNLVTCHWQNVLEVTAGAACAAVAELKANQPYHLFIDEATVGTPVAVLISLEGDFDAGSLTYDAIQLTSQQCPAYLFPDSDVTLYLKRVGGTNIAVKIAGLTPESTVTVPV